jgi:hypothetical protein
MNVFSFTLYGSNPKYVQGMIENVNRIHTEFPTWYIYIYYFDIPAWAETLLRSSPNVKMIPAEFHDIRARMERYYPIDDPDVTVMIVRDSDSRVHERDVWCIRQFIESDKVLHIVRDHPHHNWRIMSGLWGLKKAGVPFKFRDTVHDYIRSHTIKWCSDMDFLGDTVHPLLANRSLVHGMIRMSTEETVVDIPFPVVNHDFCGQVMDYPDGSDVPRHMYLDR